ncbi:MAG TPA: DUF3794 domain-containing protein [Selenomonadales bacterium]|nr:DUF3794 domain-containing protein [Selenomonadales bacterium]
MADQKRQSSGATTATSETVMVSTGTGTIDSAEMICGCPEPGPETIQVEQVLGADMKQRVVEFDMEVPDPRPDIEQVIDVFVKDVCIRSVDVIPNKVIVRGELEAKVLYVAERPDQPVQAFEKDHVRWTRDIEIDGAMPDMKATADVVVEYVNYDFHRHHHPRRVHITIVLKVWVRVVTTTEMDVYALSPIDQVGMVEVTSASSTDDLISGSAIVASTGNVFVTGPGLEQTAGVPLTVTGTSTVTANRVNVRTGPGTNFPVVTQVNRGDTVTLKDQAFGWYRVVLGDGNTTGWIAGWLLSGGGTPMG